MNHVIKHRGERGMMLVVVLWMVTTITLLVSAFNVSVNSALRVIGNELWSARVLSVLDAGVELAAFNILQDDKENRWLADGRAYQKTIAGMPLTMRVFDTGGKIDLNKSPPALLKTFLRRHLRDDRQLDPLMDAILEIRNGGSRDRNGIEAAARPARDSAGSTEDTQPAGFQHVSQLLRVPGISMALYRRLQRDVTVYNHAGLINPIIASRDVLLSLPDVLAFDVDRLLKARAAGTADAAAVRELTDGTAMVSTRRAGPAYTIVVTLKNGGTANDAGTTVTILTGPQLHAPFHVLSWETSVR